MNDNTNTPRVLARLTSEELALVNGAGRCPNHPTTDQDGNGDVGGYTIDLSDMSCD